MKDIVDGAKDVACDIGIDKIKEGVGKMWRKNTKSKHGVEKSTDKAENNIAARLDRIAAKIDELRRDIGLCRQMMYEMNQKLDRLIEHVTNPTEGTGPSNSPPAQDGIREGFTGLNGEIIGGDGTVEHLVDLL